MERRVLHSREGGGHAPHDVVLVVVAGEVVADRAEHQRAKRGERQEHKNAGFEKGQHHKRVEPRVLQHLVVRDGKHRVHPLEQVVGEQPLANQGFAERSHRVHVGPATAEKTEQHEGGGANGQREHQLGLEHPQLAGAVDLVLVAHRSEAQESASKSTGKRKLSTGKRR